MLYFILNLDIIIVYKIKIKLFEEDFKLNGGAATLLAIRHNAGLRNFPLASPFRGRGQVHYFESVVIKFFQGWSREYGI